MNRVSRRSSRCQGRFTARSKDRRLDYIRRQGLRVCVCVWGGGGTPLHKPYRYVPPQRVGSSFAPFWTENGYRFCPFWSGIGNGLRRIYCVWRRCLSFQFQMNKKESVIWEFEMDFKKSFCCSFNLSNDDIISVLWKHVMLHFVTNTRFENEYGF